MNDRTRMIQRLDTRGALTVRLDLRAKVLREVWDGTRTTTHYSAARDPVWVIFLQRPSGKGLIWDVMGWSNVHVENADLDTALAEALAHSEPHWQPLEDRVWEHQEFKRMGATA